MQEVINGENPTKFVSPLNVYWKNWLMNIVITQFLIIPVLIITLLWIFPFILKYKILLILALIIGFLWIRFANHSFYVYENNKIIRVINPYFPFKKDVKYAFEEIKEIKFLRYINRIKITTTDNISKIYLCDCLQNDYFDEHFVEKTFDDFYTCIKKNGIETFITD